MATLRITFDMDNAAFEDEFGGTTDEPQRILREGVAVQDVAVLAAVGAAGLVLAFAVFARRDL